MAAIKDEAIVLRRLDYSETSQVVQLFTRRHGPRRLIAKGIKRGTKKRFATGIDLLERGHVVFVVKPQSDARLATLTEWRQADAYLGLRSGLERLYAAQYAAEITSRMTEEGDPHPALFDALAGLLADLAEGAAVRPGLAAYQSAVLIAAGLWPDFDRCVSCDRVAPPNRAGYFSGPQGGLVCRHCADSLPEKRLVPADVLTSLRERAWPEATASPSFDLLNEVISHVIGQVPRTYSRLTPRK